MSTRYYLPSTGAAAENPAFNVAWEKTSEADRLEMVMTKISSSFATKACSENNASADYDVLNRQYVSAPIGAHNFTGCTWKAQVRCMEDNRQANFVIYAAPSCFSNDGQTNRWAGGVGEGATEFDDGELINIATGEDVQPLSSQNGDRLIFEIGIRAKQEKTTLYTATMDFGDASGTDLPENETETTQYNPWIEFSHNIAAYVPVSGYVPKIIMIT